MSTASGDLQATVKAQWNALCARLGVKPRQFAMLCGAMALVVVAVPLKSALTPARAAAAAAPMAKAASSASAPAKAAPAVHGAVSVASIPEDLLAPAPEFNLAHLPLRNPFMSLASAAPGVANPASAMPAPADIRLQATMDDDYAIINGRTVMRGQSMTDGKTGRMWTLVEVASRRVRLSCDGVIYEARIGG